MEYEQAKEELDEWIGWARADILPENCRQPPGEAYTTFSNKSILPFTNCQARALPIQFFCNKFDLDIPQLAINLHFP